MENVSKNQDLLRPQQEQVQGIFRACTLYSMNDMLYKDGLISLEKKQQVEQEIWRKYRI